MIGAALAAVRAAVARLDELAQALIDSPQDPGLLATYGETLEWVQAHEAWEADRRAHLVLGELAWPGWPMIVGFGRCRVVSVRGWPWPRC